MTKQMIEQSITIQLKEPLLVGSVRPSATGQVQETMHHIAGGTVRGAIGALLARAGHHDRHQDRVDADCPFCCMFLVGTPPRFGPFYPVGHDASESRPLPTTARTCKHQPGFKADPEAHGIRDNLFRQWAIEATFDKDHVLSPAYPFHCDQCGAELEPAGSGVYEQVDFHFFQPHVRVQRFSRAGIDRRRHVAADGLLYTLEVLGEMMSTGRYDPDGHPKSGPAIFKGRVWIEDDKQALLASQVEQIDQLGGATTRGLGAVEIGADRPRLVPLPNITDEQVQRLFEATHGGSFDPAAHHASSLITRIVHFNAGLRQIASNITAPTPTDTLYFSLDLLSDVVWTESGLPTALLPKSLAGAERIRSWATSHTHGGWHTAAQMMRRTYLAIDAGSVFLYQLQVKDVAALRGTLDALAEIERGGLGQERERGYGWIETCSPFHLEVEPK